MLDFFVFFFPLSTFSLLPPSPGLVKKIDDQKHFILKTV